MERESRKSSAETFQPRISLVMPCYQQAAYLEEAARSVLDKEPLAELIVMDPGSTDGSRELLLGLREVYGEDRLRLHFAPDKGQSDAVNAGMAMARGNVLGWLNSDDRLHPEALGRVVPLLDSSEPRWLYGSAGMIDGTGRPVSSMVVRYKNWRGRHFSYFKLLTENFIPQMAVFWNRAMWERGGGLRTTKELDMDYDLWFRFAQVVPPVVLYDCLADFRVHGDAKGSTRTDEQLAAAYATARHYAEGLGVAGRSALALHRLFSWRTRMLYKWLKP